MDYHKKNKEELIEEIKNLRHEKDNFYAVLDNIEEMFYKVSFDEKGNKLFDYVSPQIETVLGISVDQYVEGQNKLFEYFHPDDVDNLFEEIKEADGNRKKSTFIYRFYNKKFDRYFWIEETFIMIYNEDGSKKGLFGTAKNITESKEKVQIVEESNKILQKEIKAKKIVEKELKESLKEKEVLLKEVHHRVKNNLQVISSILNLQSSYIKDEKIISILKESQNRIKSMAFIHESLYQANDFSKINFSEYVIGLSKNLVHSYGIYDDSIDLKLKVEDLSLNLDLSIPCGLIINELVSNSLKYAFSEGEKGVILIELIVKGEDIELIVSDNGKGVPKDINYRNTESLGLQLVMTLVDQINGKIEMDSKEGTKYKIEFKKTE